MKIKITTDRTDDRRMMDLIASQLLHRWPTADVEVTHSTERENITAEGDVHEGDPPVEDVLSWAAWVVRCVVEGVDW